MGGRNNQKHNRFALAIIAIALMLATSILLYFSMRLDVMEKTIQSRILKMDKKMQDQVASCLNMTEFEESETGLVAFMDDSLVYWNRNDINPKVLRRRIGKDCDTICQLPNGNYYVKSYQTGLMRYYVFRKLNAHYPYNNEYKENATSIYPKWIEANVSFIPNGKGKPVVNQKGKLLSYCQINSTPKLQSPYNYVFLPLALLFVLGMVFGIYKPKHRDNNHTKKRIDISIAIIFALSILFTYIFNGTSNKRENEEMMNMAKNLSEKRDLRFEKSFAGFTELVKTDTVFRDMVFAESNVLADVILGYAKELLFDETMLAYNATLTLCEPNEEISIQPEGYITNCDNYFLEKIVSNNHERVGEGLHHIDYHTLEPNYLGEIPLYTYDSTKKKTLYLEFYKPLAPEGFGLPRILEQPNNNKPHNYSIGSYYNNILMYKYGRYVYPNYFNNLKINKNGFSNSKRFKHFTICTEENNILIVTVQRKGWTQITEPFALFFLAMLIPYLLVLWIIRPRKTNKKKKRSFQQRMQNVILLTLGISFVAIGPVSILYMSSLYNQRTRDSQFETTQTLSIEMRNDLDFQTLLETATINTWTEILQRYSTTFFTDLNLYDMKGQLIATTRPDLMETYLQAQLMNAEAFQNIHRNKALYFTHKEQLGKASFQSSYIPLTDRDGNTLAYLNTPYFASTTDLHNEIKSFVLTYINIIIVLLGIALVLVLRITKRLAQPLALIQNKMGGVKLGQKNEHIEWKDNDEIGALVGEYNKLIVELDKSATELKRTTAESAWRGVARQVAHEIKNSLTPMRLSLQLLQHNIEKGDASTEKIQRTTNTLIEQIDSLADIASSFSRYAKLPENHPQPLDLAELVGNVVNLYDNAENIKFIYDYDPTVNHTFNGDKTNLNIAVGNLVKNATQAIGSAQSGKIEVSLKDMGTAFVIGVKDNGKGIKEEDKDRVFMPNFTTKAYGSGVGLSLTYNIVQAAGGTISFESKEGEGATFIVELPKFR